MQIVRGFESLPKLGDVVATVGSFDGVHTGHKLLLESARKEAELIGGKSLVVTFEPHPRLALTPDCGMKLLTSLEERTRLIEQAGIDLLLLIHFDRAFSQTPPEEFVRRLVRSANVTKLIVGYDHRFGCNKGGDKRVLDSLSEELNFSVVEIQEQGIDSEHLSSTTIRRHVECGEIGRAASMLSHPYMVALCCDSDGSIELTEPNKLLPPMGDYTIVDLHRREFLLSILEGGKLSVKPQLEAGEHIFEFK